MEAEPARAIKPGARCFDPPASERLARWQARLEPRRYRRPGGAESISRRPPTSSTRSCMPISPKPPLCGCPGSKPAAVVADRHGQLRPLPPRSRRCTVGAGVLDRVGQRLLHEPIDGRSRPPLRAARRARARGSSRSILASTSSPDVAEVRSRQGLERGLEAQLVERRRPQLGDQALQPADAEIQTVDGPLHGLVTRSASAPCAPPRASS